MSEIKCPNCGKTFKIDENSYADIVRQVRDSEYSKDIEAKVHDATEVLHAKAAAEYLKLKNEKETEIAKLEAKISSFETEKKLAVSEASSKLEKELAEEKMKNSNEREKYKNALELKEEQISQLKDFKAKQSTKMVGESLEQFCHDEFDKIRAAAFPNAYFEKDNDAKTGSKGDFIFKESDENGVEYVSIMFEMKNEADDDCNET